MNNTRGKNLLRLLFTLVVLGLLSACSIAHKPTPSPRTAIEQLLLSEAVIRSLPQELEKSLSIPQGANVILDTSGISGDVDLVQQVLVGWLGQQGYQVQGDEEQATHRVNAVVESFGTELGDTFFGMPPVQSVLIPFALPELILYKAQYQTGYVKFYLDIFELPSGRFLQATPPFLAETYYNDYTVLFIFSFISTDLLAPPELGSFRNSEEDQPNEEESSETQPQNKDTFPD